MSKSYYYFTINYGLQRIVYDLVGIFGVLYLYALFGNSVEISIGILSLIYILNPFFIFLFLPVFEKLGMKKMLVVAGFISAISVIPMCFFYTQEWWIFGLWVVLSSISKAFYYIPYHFYNIYLTQDIERGKEFSKFNSFIIILNVITPIVGGLTTQFFGMQGVVVLSAFIALCSILPAAKMINYEFHISKNIIDLISQIDMQKIFKILSIEEFQAKEVFWQCFIFIAVGESYSGFGLLISFITLITIPILRYIGTFSDHHNKKRMLQLQGFFTSIVWLARLMVNTLYQIIFIDILHKVNLNTRGQTMSLVLYDLATKDGQELLLDEKVIVREAFDNLVLGLGLLSGVVIYYFFGFNGVFLFAGLVSLLYIRI